MANKLSLVIFDMDGVLLDTERQMWIHNGMKALKEYGVEVDYEYLKTLTGKPVGDYKKGILKRYGNDFPVDEYVDRLYQYNYQMIDNNEITLMNGAIELLKHLKQKGLPIHLATSTNSVITKKMLTNTKIIDYFDLIICGDEIQNGKPAPDIYLKALNGFSNNEAIIFEDSHNGARAAISAKIKLILVPDIATIEKQDYQDAYKVINNLNEAIDIIDEMLKSY